MIVHYNLFDDNVIMRHVSLNFKTLLKLFYNLIKALTSKPYYRICFFVCLMFVVWYN